MKEPKKHMPEEDNASSSKESTKNSGPDMSTVDQKSCLPEDQLLDELEEKQKKMEELLSRIEELEKEKEEMKESMARSRADLYNFRQRTERERGRERKLAREASVMDILPVLDNLDRALSFPEGTDPSSVLEGVVMVQRQFVSVLNGMGVKDIPSIGEAFSPEFHEAVAVKEVQDPEQDGFIVEEFLRGYIIADKVIRPARVQVAKFVGSTQKQDTQNSHQ